MQIYDPEARGPSGLKPSVHMPKIPPVRAALPGSMRQLDVSLGGIPSTIAIKIVEATVSDSEHWHEKVLPFIRKGAGRLDATWDWHKLVKQNTMLHRMQRALQRRSFITFTVLACIKDVETPVAMLHLASPYPWVAGNNTNAVFVWYLASAPQSYLESELGIKARLLGPMIDSAVVYSFAQEMEGRISLHADPRGGEDLEQRYERVGLTRLANNKTLPMSRRAKEAVESFFADDESGGAYFYSTTEVAGGILKAYTHAREA